MKINNRLLSVKEYHFKKLDDMKKNLYCEGKEVIDLGIGDPDLPVEKNIVSALVNSLSFKNFNKYPPYEGIDHLKKQIIKYYSDVYSVNLNMDEVLILIGSKEGISNLIPAVCNIGDTAIIPELGYPVYGVCCNLWGVKAYKVSLKRNYNYLVNFNEIPNNVISESKLVILNYPNNPTGAIATPDFYKEAISFCKKNNIVLCNDGAYNEIIKPGDMPLSLLQFDKEKYCIEIGTFSKIYNMTGFRIGYIVGNSDIISSILKIKSNVDSGQFIPIQYAAAEALTLGRDYVNKIRKIYYDRRSCAEKILTEHNIDYFKTNGTFYIWCTIPQNYTTDEFCEELLIKNGIIVSPGYSYGSLGYGYFRIAMTNDISVIRKALNDLNYY